ncbi:hypothetical protein NARC_70176 [Candidatus Nitrosocosmicus arcticus]|uniref:Uncharacterized protein n=2 Tax=Candidatus Nitrosocosmicus arcticus TaxID=2035267 RepID=A0A557SVF6_9ARCH|nr:hypothetical protein NARC_70176 [Candidatus Nitrosocosmicus arcticus]
MNKCLNNSLMRIRWNKMADSIVDWESIVHKNVRSKDFEDAGNVDAVNDNSVIITSQGDRKEYSLPKDQVEGYNGAEVTLKISLSELESYKV